MGILRKTISVGDLFIAAIVPGLILVVAYAIYFVLFVKVSSEGQSQDQDDLEVPKLIRSLLPPFALIFIVLGSIISGVASPTEAAGIGL